MVESPVSEYTPLEVKQAVTGYGGADKNQVQQMVRALLGLPDIPSPDDAADALAIGICHLHSARMKSIYEEVRLEKADPNVFLFSTQIIYEEVK